LRIAELEIPEQVKEVLAKRGYVELYPPQEDAIRRGVLDGKNLVMASPTASGKTLIAELCALKHVIERGGKALYLTPLRALAWEKYETFQAYTGLEKRDGGKVRVGISTGDYDSSTPWLENYDIIITSVDYEEPTIIREDGVIKIIKIGELIDELMGSERGRVRVESGVEVLDISDLNLEAVAFDQENFELAFRKISKVVRHKANEPLYRLRLETGREVSVTGSHSIYTLEGLNITTKRVSEIKVGDIVLVPKRLPSNPLKNIEINLAREIMGLKEAGNLFVKNLPKEFFESSAFKDLRARNHDKKNWKRRGELPLGKVIELELDKKLDLSQSFFSYTASRHKVPIKIPVNWELAKLLGYYVAEGSIDEKNYRVSFSLNSEEIEYIEDIIKCTETLFHFKPSINKRKNVTYIDICDKIVYLFFDRVLNLPRGAKEKRIPQIILNVGQELQLEFLRCLVRGDGSFKPRICYTTSSKLLASDLLYLLLQNNIIGGFSYEEGRRKLPSDRSVYASHFNVYVSSWSERSCIDTYPELNEPHHQYGHRICMIPTEHIKGILEALGRSSNGSFINFGKRTNKDKFRKWLALREKRTKLKLLNFLETYESLTSGQVSRLLGISWSAANDELKSLLGKGLISREGSEGHYRYYISDKGLYLLREIELARKLLNSHLSFARVRRIERVKPSRKYVYDFSIPGCENFVAGLGGVICHNTNEKCDSLLRHKAPWLGMVTLVIADEIHLIGNERGPTLEVALARLRQVRPDIQVIALSATIRNAEDVAEWLKAEAVTTEWRPVELREGVLYRDTITFRDGGLKRLKRLHRLEALNIALNTVLEGDQALIFVESRLRSMSMAREAADALEGMEGILQGKLRRELEKVSDEILSYGERTRLSDELASAVLRGAAFHHAGLKTEHRRIVEDSFRSGKIKILVATPTLAAGVNLPAKTVIIGSYHRFTPGYGMTRISVLEYKQMSGRAGRPQYDAYGEAALIASSQDEAEELMESYILSKPEPLYSRLASEPALRCHTLAAIASDYAHTEDGLLDFFGGTFYGYHYSPLGIRGLITSMLRYLEREGMIQRKGDYMYASDFGRRVSELYIDPLSAVVIRDGLRLGAKKTSDFTWLHLICRTPDMRPLLRPRRREYEAVESFINEHADEFACEIPDYGDMIEFEQFLGEVKTAMVLQAWIEEASENDLLERFSVEPGDRYSAVLNAEWLLYASHELARVLGISSHTRHLSHLTERVRYGVKAELLPLVKLRGIGRVRARMLYKAGFRTVESLRRAPISKLAGVPLIGGKLARLIKEQVGGVVEEEEWRRLEEIEAEQKALTTFIEEEPEEEKR
jgi:helicase